MGSIYWQLIDLVEVAQEEEPSLHIRRKTLSDTPADGIPVPVAYRFWFAEVCANILTLARNQRIQHLEVYRVYIAGL